MVTLAAVLAGACYSAAYIAPKPYCYIALVVSMLLVWAMRAGL